MVVAVIAVRAMEASVDDVVDMVTMGHGLVTTIGAVDVPVFVFGVGNPVASFWIGFRHGQDVLFDGTILILVMEMTVVQVIDVPVMFNCSVSTTFTVFVLVLFFGKMFFTHCLPSIEQKRIFNNAVMLKTSALRGAIYLDTSKQIASP